MGTGYIDYAGYKECVNLQNDDVQVVLGPHCGGRVLAYAWHGENALALDPRQDGWTYGAGTPPMGGPSGRRFDFGLDSHAGWFAYVMPNDMMFVKAYPTYPERVYGEMTGLTISLWYMRDFVCELEPIGPREILLPGASASFTETWYLTPYAFPEVRAGVDPAHVAEVAKELMI